MNCRILEISCFAQAIPAIEKESFLSYHIPIFVEIYFALFIIINILSFILLDTSSYVHDQESGF